VYHPNTAVYIPEWDKKHTLPDGLPKIYKEAITYVNWNALDEWGRKRAL